jgi:light-regulated signal transduction histidine kinase (bacteriophytochrome)
VSIEEGIVADGDPLLLKDMMANLIGNAWKYTGKKSGARICFGSSVKDGKDVFYVRDNGAGFDMAYADKLFGVFQRLHSSDDYAGHGIGLATVQRIINLHGGKVWAEGTVGLGATFFFTLS